MFELTIDRSGLDELIADVGRFDLSKFTIDFGPLGALIAQQLIEENRLARNQAEDARGGILVDIKESTRRRRAYNGGDPNAPPFIPHHDDSRVISNFATRVATATDGVTIEVFLTGCWWLTIHATGGKWLPIRDIIGTSPEIVRWIEDVFTEYVRLRLIEYVEGRPASGFNVADLPQTRRA